MARAAVRVEALAVGIWLSARLVRHVRPSWQARVAVSGHSMEPTVRSGDWLLVDPSAYRDRPPRVGDLVVAPDPREGSRLLVKRVGFVAADGGLLFIGDAPDASTDSRDFGAVDPRNVVGRPWFRYWPLREMGRLR